MFVMLVLRPPLTFSCFFSSDKMLGMLNIQASMGKAAVEMLCSNSNVTLVFDKSCTEPFALPDASLRTRVRKWWYDADNCNCWPFYFLFSTFTVPWRSEYHTLYSYKSDHEWEGSSFFFSGARFFLWQRRATLRFKLYCITRRHIVHHAWYTVNKHNLVT